MPAASTVLLNRLLARGKFRHAQVLMELVEPGSVQRAADGKAAQQIIAGMAAPAIVTLDLALPAVQGDELMIQMRSQPGWERVPVLMVTAKPKDKDMAWAIKSGAQGYLVKPFKPEQLREQVRKLVARKPVA